MSRVKGHFRRIGFPEWRWGLTIKTDDGWFRGSGRPVRVRVQRARLMNAGPRMMPYGAAVPAAGGVPQAGLAGEKKPEEMRYDGLAGSRHTSQGGRRQ